MLPEKDANGKPYLPTYYKGRIYIDLSEPERYTENFDKLLRWIYDKPLHVKPEIGKAPSFLDEGQAISLGITMLQNRLLDALRNGKSNAIGILDEYLNIFFANMARFSLTAEEINADPENSILGSIEKFTPARNEFVQVMVAISNYLPTKEAATKIHHFFEQLHPYMYRAEGQREWNRFQFDNFRFIVHELFLYAIAILLKSEKFDLVAGIISMPFYIAWHSESGKSDTVSFEEFCEYAESFKFRDDRLRKLSSRADLLKERAEISSVDFISLMQADFILFMRSALDDINCGW